MLRPVLSIHLCPFYAQLPGLRGSECKVLDELLRPSVTFSFVRFYKCR